MTVRRLDFIHIPSYFRFCNVLHIWTIRAIPTYRVYRLYDIAGTSEGENLANVDVLYQVLAWWRTGSASEQSTL